MNHIAFTCLIPVVGGDDPDHFRAAMASIAASSLAPDAIVICQDGATPASLEAAIAATGATLGARVVVNPGPRGLEHNLNHAMAQVRTPWVARADADDLNLPGRFEAQAAFLRAHPDVGALGGAIVEFWPDGASRRKPMPLTHDEIVGWARWRNPINHMTAFFRTDLFVACGGYPDLPLREDYGLWLKMIGQGARLANLPEDLVRARLGASFYSRRSGLSSLRSEAGLYRLKRQIPQIGGPVAAAAMVARACALALPQLARPIYEWGLRRQPARPSP